jgi:hypothetical protein
MYRWLASARESQRFGSSVHLVTFQERWKLPDLVDLLRMSYLLVLLGIVLLSVLSLWSTRRTSRRILQEALDRPVADVEQSSVATWMKVPDDQLPRAGQALVADPFGRVARRLMQLADRPPESRHSSIIDR